MRRVRGSERRALWTRMGGRYSLLALVIGGVTLVPIPEAAAIQCSAEETLFRRAPTSSADGIKSEVFIRDRDLNDNCSESSNPYSEAETHSTTHLRGPSFDNFVEVGWVENFGSGSTHHFKYFYEWRIGSTVMCGFDCGPGTTSGEWTGLKIVNVAGTDNWTVHVDWSSDGDWSRIGPAEGVDANLTQGIPMGETGRRGYEGTGAMDDHRILSRKLCESCAWEYWGDNEYHTDNISNWHGVRQHGHRYTVEKD
jgi:hypothetical protein